MRIISGSARGTKLYTLDGANTRPTLDRVKEPLFNIINFKLQDAIVLDLFAGSGALGLESISRGAQKAIFCENNKEAIKIIEKNIAKTKFYEKAVVIKNDFDKALNYMSGESIKLDIIFLDPPYKTDLILKSLKRICELNLLNNDGVVVIETDEPERIRKEIHNVVDIYDSRKYGRVTLMFAKQIE